MFQLFFDVNTDDCGLRALDVIELTLLKKCAFLFVVNTRCSGLAMRKGEENRSAQLMWICVCKVCRHKRGWLGSSERLMARVDGKKAVRS